ncbi:MAG: filamentous hemagglutinin N-terminal domain-containing protein, partial [Cyanobacteria bacterium J06641_5]
MRKSQLPYPGHKKSSKSAWPSISWGWCLGKSCLAIAVLWVGNPKAISAQTQSAIVPDETLGAESSVVVPGVEIRGVDSTRIDGGARRGGNLFHSFQEFNVELNRGAYFSNPTGVDNILTRVTGSNLSKIDGTLGVLGDANLFLINPNGLIFGPGASLDLNGSFIGSTAESVLFEEYGFSAVDPSAPSMLTLDVPIGFRRPANQWGHLELALT